MMLVKTLIQFNRKTENMIIIYMPNRVILFILRDALSKIPFHLLPNNTQLMLSLDSFNIW